MTERRRWVEVTIGLQSKIKQRRRLRPRLTPHWARGLALEIEHLIAAGEACVQAIEPSAVV